MICKTIADCLARRDDGQGWPLNDFVLDWTGERQERRKSPEELLQHAQFITGLFSEMNEAKRDG